MLRVTQMDDQQGRTLKLEGKLSGPWVEELRKCWETQGKDRRQGALRVNLREVNYVDNRGRDLLIEMEHEGVSLVEESDFIRHLLRDEMFGRKPAPNGSLRN
jgi:ABC-type transporter Mla MlaB component